VRVRGLQDRLRPCRLRENDRAENASAYPKQGAEDAAVRSHALAQRFLTTHAGVYNTFYTQRHLMSRPPLRIFRSAANDAWIKATMAV
jgi:putative transposase